MTIFSINISVGTKAIWTSFGKDVVGAVISADGMVIGKISTERIRDREALKSLYPREGASPLLQAEYGHVMVRERITAAPRDVYLHRTRVPKKVADTLSQLGDFVAPSEISDIQLRFTGPAAVQIERLPDGDIAIWDRYAHSSTLAGVIISGNEVVEKITKKKFDVPAALPDKSKILEAVSGVFTTWKPVAPPQKLGDFLKANSSKLGWQGKKELEQALKKACGVDIPYL
jgi:hypothetical protein